jgi:hypothetical protein
MSVGGIRGGGRSGGPKGASGKGGASRAGGATFGKIDKSEKLASTSGLVGSGNVGEAGAAASAGPADPISAQALEIARQLKSGQLKSREEATKKFVAEILKDKLHMQSKSLTQKVADALQDDPRLSQALERIWDHGTR